MRPLLYGIVGITLILVLVLTLIAPLFLDWTRHRASIETLLEEALGEEVRSLGRIDVVLLPAPTLSMTDLRIGSSEAPTARIERVDLQLSLPALIRRTWLLTYIRLTKPVFSVLLSKEELPLPLLLRSESNGNSFFHKTRFEKLEIRQGTVHLRRANEAAPLTLHGLEMDVITQGAEGPIKASGRVHTPSRQASFSLTLAKATRVPAPQRTRSLYRTEPWISLPLAGQVTFSPVEATARVDSQSPRPNPLKSPISNEEIQDPVPLLGFSPLTLSFDSRLALGAPLWRLAGRFKAMPISIPAEKDISWQSEGNFEADWGKITAQATLFLPPQESPSSDVVVSHLKEPIALTRMLRGEGILSFDPTPHYAVSFKTSQDTLLLPTLFPLKASYETFQAFLGESFAFLKKTLLSPPLPVALPGTITWDIPRLILGGQRVEKTLLHLEQGPRGWEKARLRTDLPGETRLQIEGHFSGKSLDSQSTASTKREARARFEGEGSLESKKPALFLKFLGVPADPLARVARAEAPLSLTSALILEEKGLHFDALTLRHGRTRLTGKIDLDFENPLTPFSTISLDFNRSPVDWIRKHAFPQDFSSTGVFLDNLVKLIQKGPLFKIHLTSAILEREGAPFAKEGVLSVTHATQGAFSSHLSLKTGEGSSLKSTVDLQRQFLSSERLSPPRFEANGQMRLEAQSDVQMLSLLKAVTAFLPSSLRENLLILEKKKTKDLLAEKGLSTEALEELASFQRKLTLNFVSHFSESSAKNPFDLTLASAGKMQSAEFSLEARAKSPTDRWKEAEFAFDFDAQTPLETQHTEKGMLFHIKGAGFLAQGVEIYTEFKTNLKRPKNFSGGEEIETVPITLSGTGLLQNLLGPTPNFVGSLDILSSKGEAALPTLSFLPLLNLPITATQKGFSLHLPPQRAELTFDLSSTPKRIVGTLAPPEISFLKPGLSEIIEVFLFVFGDFQTELGLHTPKLVLAPGWEIEDTTLAISRDPLLRERIGQIEIVESRFAQGTLRAGLQILPRRGQNFPQMAGQIFLKEAQIEHPRLRGHLDAALRFEGVAFPPSGNLTPLMGLSGYGNITLREARIEGIPIPTEAELRARGKEAFQKTKKEAHRLKNTLTRATLRGMFRLSGEKILFDTLTLSAPKARGYGTAEIDIESGEMRSQWTLGATSEEEAGSSLPPQIHLFLEGPLSAPRQRLEGGSSTEFLPTELLQEEEHSE